MDIKNILQKLLLCICLNILQHLPDASCRRMRYEDDPHSLNALSDHNIGQVTDFLGYRGKGTPGKRIPVNSIAKRRKKYGYGYDIDRMPKGVDKPKFFAVETNPDFHENQHSDDKDAFTATLIFAGDEFSKSKHGIAEEEDEYERKSQRYPAKYPKHFPKHKTSQGSYPPRYHPAPPPPIKKDDGGGVVQGLLVIPTEIEKPKMEVSSSKGYDTRQQQQHGAPEPMGYRAPEPMGYGPPEPMGYGAPEPVGYGAPEPMGYGAPESMGYGAPEPMRYGAPEPMGYGASEPVGYGASEPMGYGTSESERYEMSQPQGYGPTEPQQGYEQQADPHGFNFGVQISYKPDKGEQQQSGGYGQQPSSGEYGQQPSSGGYGQQPSSGGYGQQPSSGGYDQQEQSKEKVSGLLILLAEKKTEQQQPKGYGSSGSIGYSSGGGGGHSAHMMQNSYGIPDPHSNSYGFPPKHEESGYGKPKRRVIKRKIIKRKKKRNEDPFEGLSKDEKVVLLYK